jgi:hypothetical protein
MPGRALLGALQQGFGDRGSGVEQVPQPGQRGPGLEQVTDEHLDHGRDHEHVRDRLVDDRLRHHRQLHTDRVRVRHYSELDGPQWPPATTSTTSCFGNRDVASIRIRLRDPVS